ncbi:hypothetical protein HMPREF9714_03354 [Myroides odoratimimus CCUG 12901]|uniref:site-specific integrase n=1 Tax=Myroides odoratimimus TaxID=76832 RepID=UPI000246115A|nr:site-specific integrase [Myroides odoratimimus]EHO05416.1 hypothetical protein HMPREF9714_03354 [Myroides odoratimimus CCUG 12901]
MSTKNIQEVIYSPVHAPQKKVREFVNRISKKVILKKENRRVDGTCPLYIQVFLNGERKLIPLRICVVEDCFDKIKQRVKRKHKEYLDLNLIIEKVLAELNEIEVAYRLSKRLLTLPLLMNEYENPSAQYDFLTFYESELEKEKKVLAPASYVQQRAVLRKLRRYKERILFHEFTEDFMQEVIHYFKTKEKNSHNTISTLTKNVKKYLSRANKQGLWAPMHSTEIPHKSMRGTINFLTALEINSIYDYYKSEFIQYPHKVAAAKFLFSCFTGLRISDIEKLSVDKVVNNETLLVLPMVKGGKLLQMKLNDVAKSLVLDGFIFEQMSKAHLRNHVHSICTLVGIKKRVNYHMSRHSFATNFLMQGGRVEILQRLMGHSSLQMTMVYVHIVQDVVNDQIMLMDNIIKKVDKEKPAE